LATNGKAWGLKENKGSSAGSKKSRGSRGSKKSRGSRKSQRSSVRKRKKKDGDADPVVEEEPAELDDGDEASNLDDLMQLVTTKKKARSRSFRPTVDAPPGSAEQPGSPKGPRRMR
jgi:hypothetical protein